LLTFLIIVLCLCHAGCDMTAYMQCFCTGVCFQVFSFLFLSFFIVFLFVYVCVFFFISVDLRGLIQIKKERKKKELYYVDKWENCAAFNRGNLSFWRYRKLSHTNNSVQDKRKHRKYEHFFELLQMLKIFSTSVHVLSQHLSQTRGSFILLTIIFPCFLQCDFSFRNRNNSDAAFKQLYASLRRHDICSEVKIGELGDHCFFWIICRQFS